MLFQDIIWTVLPNGIAGPLAAGSKLRLSVYVSPRLSSGITKRVLTLGDFAQSDFVNWPQRLSRATYQVEFQDGPTLPAIPERAELRPDLWRALFTDNTRVGSFAFQDLSNVFMRTFPTNAIHSVIQQIYQEVATKPYHQWGEGQQLPTWGGLKERTPSELGAVAGDAVAAYKGIKDDFDAIRSFLAPTNVSLPTSDTTEFHDMIATLGDYPILLRYLGLVIDLVVTLDETIPPQSTVKVIPKIPLIPLRGIEAEAPTSSTATTFPNQPSMPTTFPAPVARPEMVTKYHFHPRTHYALYADKSGGTYFVTQPRSDNPEINNGLLRLNETQRFQVQQLDVVDGALKLQNAATTILKSEKPANTPNEVGLPALRTAGISVVRSAPATRGRIRPKPTPSPNLEESKQHLRRAKSMNDALAARNEAACELYAEDVVRGYRIDVWDDHSQRWHSLCRRLGTYKFLAVPEVANGELEFTLEDEGFAEMAATEGKPDGEERELRIHESLFTWDGWSLSALRPGKQIRLAEDTSLPVDDPNRMMEYFDNQAATQFQMTTRFQAKPKSLPRLRYGYSYRLRARVVDLAGNSLFGPDDARFEEMPDEVTPQFKFRRFEPVSPPFLLPRQLPGRGESLERIAVRTQYDENRKVSAERHLLPPKTSLGRAEQHGRFDAGSDMLGDRTGYELAVREAGTPTHRLVPVFENGQENWKLEEISGVKHEDKDKEKAGHYWLQEEQSFDLAYLPDPAARGILLRFYAEGKYDKLIYTVSRPFEGRWPDLKPLRLRLLGLSAGSKLRAPEWATDDPLCLNVWLRQAESLSVRTNCFILPPNAQSVEALDDWAIWHWIDQEIGEQKLTNGNRLLHNMKNGENWLCMPYRTLTLVHAVQQPLQLPAFVDVGFEKDLYDTVVKMTSGSIAVDAKSTAKVDLWADWSDWTDDSQVTSDNSGNKPWPIPNIDSLTKPGELPPSQIDLIRKVGHRMHVAEIPVIDPTKNDLTVEGLRHVIGDTKYHQVTYSAIATTRFREYFDEHTDSKSLIRPTEQEQKIKNKKSDPKSPSFRHIVDVPNSARPAAPKLLYVVPAFAWDPSHSTDHLLTSQHNEIERTRQGGWVRVYMERPWYSSGDNELLAAVVEPVGIQYSSKLEELRDLLKNYTSAWGADPIWPGGQVAPLTLSDFANPVEQVTYQWQKKEGTGPKVNLASHPDIHVQLAAYKPEFDVLHRRWYCDLQIRPGSTASANSYFPFVRLALARYQPNSMDEAHLSPVVLADFVQLMPERTTHYTMNTFMGIKTLSVEARGPSYVYDHRGQHKTTIMAVRLEERSTELSEQEQVLGWHPLWTKRLDIKQPALEETLWKGSFAIPSQRPLRLVLLEAELLPVDDDRSDGPSDILDLLKNEVVPEKLPFYQENELVPVGYRIVFADTVIIS